MYPRTSIENSILNERPTRIVLNAIKPIAHVYRSPTISLKVLTWTVQNLNPSNIWIIQLQGQEQRFFPLISLNSRFKNPDNNYTKKVDPITAQYNAYMGRFNLSFFFSWSCWHDNTKWAPKPSKTSPHLNFLIPISMAPSSGLSSSYKSRANNHKHLTTFNYLK